MLIINNAFQKTICVMIKSMTPGNTLTAKMDLMKIVVPTGLAQLGFGCAKISSVLNQTKGVMGWTIVKMDLMKNSVKITCALRTHGNVLMVSASQQIMFAMGPPIALMGLMRKTAAIGNVQRVNGNAMMVFVFPIC